MAIATGDAIETFTSITGASEAVAVQRLEEHGGDLHEAVNAHFNSGDRTSARQTPVAVSQNDFMDIDDPFRFETRRPSLPPYSAGRNLNPLSNIDPIFPRSLFESRVASEFSSHAPFVSHPRDVQEVATETKDENDQLSHSGLSPIIDDVVGVADAHRHVINENEEDEGPPIHPPIHTPDWNERKASFSGDNHYQTHVSSASNVGTDYSNDVEEEMVLAAIEASKREAEEGYPNQQFGGTNVCKDSSGIHPEVAPAVSMSLKMAEQEKAQHEQGLLIGASQQHDSCSSHVGELGKLPSENGRQGFGSFGKATSSQFNLEAGSSSVLDKAKNVEEQPLVNRRSKRLSSGSVGSDKDAGKMMDSPVSPPSSPRQHDVGTHRHHTRVTFHSDEWGGISSEEHDEALMLEAAHFGEIAEGTAYHFDVGSYGRRMPRPPSPTLAAQRLLREQQDDEYLASLQADQEKEMKAREEAESRRLEEEASRAAFLQEERHREEEAHMKMLEEEEFERHLAAKEASLPQEPASDDATAVTLLVRMPDGSRRGRRFRKSDKLQSLFDFIDVGRGVKPGSYKLVRPYPRRAFSDGESELSLGELGLTNKQEALYMELI